MDIRTSLAAQNYAGARPATAPQPKAEGAGGVAAEAAGSFVKTLQQGEETAKAAMTGGADPQSLVQALANSELAVETAVTLRDRVVEAYQEILRMPV